MILNKQQEEAKNQIVDWFKNIKTTHKKIYVLNGPAGTGKTTTVSYIIKEELKIKDTQVAFVTPTGKASSVLLQKGSNACTIHKLIYSLKVDDNEVKIKGKTFKVKKLNFIKKKNIGDFKLIVLDEVSMVNKKMMDDLESYDIPILATGDDAQLPAVCAEGNGLLNKPDFTLTEIVRQAADNPILKIATDVRLHRTLNYGEYGNVSIISHNNLTDTDLKNILLSADQVICGKNSTRVKLNNFIREAKGIKDKLPISNEKAICNLNNYEVVFDLKYPLVNGMICYLDNFKILDEELKIATVSVRPDFLDKWVDNVLIDYDIFESNEYKYEKHQMVMLMYDGSYGIEKKMEKMKPGENKEVYLKELRKNYAVRSQSIGSFMINQFEFGYAISCHKSQGSEWDSVVVLDESLVFNKDKYRWLYTACTRAKKKLIIIR